MSTAGQTPPFFAALLLLLMRPLVPSCARLDWYSCWKTRLINLWILGSRPEVGLHPPRETGPLLRAAFAEAFWLRFTRARLRRFVRGPAFVLAMACVAFVALYLLSSGFAATSDVVAATIELQIDPPVIGHDPRAMLVIAHFIPILLALTVGLALVMIGRQTLRGRGWRYGIFLAVKLLAVVLFVPVLWTEASAGLWHRMPHELLRVWIAGIGSTLAFLWGFGTSVMWAFSDQRRRCPVCLHLLARPVTMGSWASVLEPATTEFVCDEGHGALAIAENEIGADDRWVALDGTWRGL